MVAGHRSAYALCEGLALGGISAMLERSYHGIAIQAFGLTLGVTAVMLALYTSSACSWRDTQIHDGLLPRRRHFPG